MGCLNSQPRDSRTPSQRPAKVSSLSSATTKHAVNAQQSKLSTTTNSSPQTSASYETNVSASLSDSTTSNVPFHGLLTNTGKLNLLRRNNESENQLFNRGVDVTEETDPRLINISGIAMTMPYTVIVSSLYNQAEAEITVRKLIQSIFSDCDMIMNGWNVNSEISNINSLKPEKKLALSPELSCLFDIVDNVYDITDGRFDPTTGCLSAAFENCIIDHSRPPQPTELTQLKFALGWRKRISRNAKTNLISRLNAHTLIDLDGISKGHIIDIIIKRLIESRFENVFVDWAGDVRTIGKHPSGREWICNVMRPPELSRVFHHWRESTLHTMLSSKDIGYRVMFNANGCALATSGDYFSILKYGFHHIVNVKDMSLLKASGLSIASVCIVASSCAIADALATVGMTFKDIKQASEFFIALEKLYPELIFGHCIMGRANSANSDVRSEYEMYSDSIFMPVTKINDEDEDDEDDDDEDIEAIEAVEKVSATYSEEWANIIRDRIFKFKVDIEYEGKTTEIDSFTSCSMDPYPLVTFSLPLNFIENVHTTTIPSYAIEDEQQKNNAKDNVSNMKCTFLTCGDDKNNNVVGNLEIRSVEHVDVDGECDDSNNDNKFVLITAFMVDVSFGTISNYIVKYKKRGLLKREVNLNGIARSKFKFLEISQKVKTLFRHIPANVWIITTQGIDGSQYAITATSVCVQRDGNLTLNIAHSSTFYAGLGFDKSTKLTINALFCCHDGETMAKKFVAQCSPDANDMKCLNNGLISIDCHILSSVNVQDHVVICAKICYLRHGDVQRRVNPLVWIGGQYASWISH